FFNPSVLMTFSGHRTPLYAHEALGVASLVCCSIQCSISSARYRSNPPTRTTGKRGCLRVEWSRTHATETWSRFATWAGVIRKSSFMTQVHILHTCVGLSAHCHPLLLRQDGS